jgi:hypothetical protein
LSGAQSLWRLLAACLLLAAAPAHAGFDAPLKKQVVQVWSDVGRRSVQVTLTCYYYPTFMVAEIKDSREPISVSAVEPGSNQRCEENSKSETRWGALRGVVGDFLFFDGGSAGSHGERAFEITNSHSQMVTWESRIGDFQSIHLAPGGFVLRYRRVFRHNCSLYYGGATECWGEIKAKTGLTDASTPECRGAYEDLTREYKKKWPERAKDVKSHSASTSYDVEARFLDGKMSFTALPGPAECWPSY